MLDASCLWWGWGRSAIGALDCFAKPLAGITASAVPTTEGKACGGRCLRDTMSRIDKQSMCLGETVQQVDGCAWGLHGVCPSLCRGQLNHPSTDQLWRGSCGVSCGGALAILQNPPCVATTPGLRSQLAAHSFESEATASYWPAPPSKSNQLFRVVPSPRLATPSLWFWECQCVSPLSSPFSPHTFFYCLRPSARAVSQGQSRSNYATRICQCSTCSQVDTVDQQRCRRSSTPMRCNT